MVLDFGNICFSCCNEDPQAWLWWVPPFCPLDPVETKCSVKIHGGAFRQNRHLSPIPPLPPKVTDFCLQSKIPSFGLSTVWIQTWIRSIQEASNFHSVLCVHKASAPYSHLIYLGLERPEKLGQLVAMFATCGNCMVAKQTRRKLTSLEIVSPQRQQDPMMQVFLWRIVWKWTANCENDCKNPELCVEWGRGAIFLFQVQDLVRGATQQFEILKRSTRRVFTLVTQRQKFDARVKNLWSVWTDNLTLSIGCHVDFDAQPMWKPLIARVSQIWGIFWEGGVILQGPECRCQPLDLCVLHRSRDTKTTAKPGCCVTSTSHKFLFTVHQQIHQTCNFTSVPLKLGNKAIFARPWYMCLGCSTRRKKFGKLRHSRKSDSDQR